MNHRSARAVAGAVAVVFGAVVLLDVLRVWLPSIITIFGQAASTPVEHLAGFGLIWFVLGLAAPLLARLAGPARLAVAAAVLLAVARLALPLTGGGQAQLYVACVGLVLGLAWLAGAAMTGVSPLAGLAGLGVAAVLHAALSSIDLTWRSGPLAWLLLLTEVAAFLTAATVAARHAGPDPVEARPAGEAGPYRGWFLFGPAALLCGMWATAPALVDAAVSHWTGRLAGYPHVGATLGGAGAAISVLLLSAAVLGLAAGAVLAPGRRWAVWLSAVTLVAAAAAFGANWTTAMPVAIVLGAVALGGCFAAAVTPGVTPGVTAGVTPGVTPGPGADVGRGRPATRAGFAAVGGMIVFAVAAVAFYASYDAGYPNWWVPPAVALAVAVPAWRARAPRAATGGGPVVVPAPRAVLAAVATVALVAAGAWWAPPAERPASGDELRLVAYNIRMGFGLDGRFSPDRLAAVISAHRPDVVLLSEVDRGWLLNGGHDSLAAIARRLDMRYLFGPAADQVWGDAVLTRPPVRDAQSHPLPADGAPTGAQALAVRLVVGDRQVSIVSTHLQPPPGGPPMTQARELVRFTEQFRRGGPAVIAGDLNVEPATETFGVLERSGYVDALAGSRPLRTSPAEQPRNEIDHVLVTPDLVGDGALAPITTDSDHLPVVVTLSRAG